MFKIIGLLFLILAFLAIMALMFFASVIFSVVRKLRKMIYGDETNREHEYTRRRQQQYSYRGGNTGQQSASNTRQQAGSGGVTDNETIIDTRSPHQTSSRIFDDNEGEYVDFIEEK